MLGGRPTAYPVFGRGILPPPIGGGYQAASSEGVFENGGGARQGMTPRFLQSREISELSVIKALICNFPPRWLQRSGSISKMRFMQAAQLLEGFAGGSISERGVTGWLTVGGHQLGTS